MGIAIDNEIVSKIRDMKAKGQSLLFISRELKIAKSTVSLYCRDMFEHPKRRYPTRAIALKAIKQSVKKCPTCDTIIRKCRPMCKKCLAAYFKRDNPLCPYCGEKTTKDGFHSLKTVEVRYRQYDCPHCGKHSKECVSGEQYLPDLRLYRYKNGGSKPTTRKRELISIDEIEAIYANNTGYRPIDEMTCSLSKEYRADVRQDCVLYCLEFGIDIQTVEHDVLRKIVRGIAKKYISNAIIKGKREISIYKKPFEDSDITIGDMIADPNADFIKDIEEGL
jgi:hypothetical protein